MATRSDLADAIVFGVPRGGVPVAYEVALSLTLPLDVLVVRKLGVPTQPELAMGALGEDGVVVVDDEVIVTTHVSPEEFAKVEARERIELGRRVRIFLGVRTSQSLDGRTVVIVDDGIATGSTCRTACRVVRARGADRVLLAVPVTSATTVENLRGEANDVISLVSVEGSFSVGQWYEHFEETPDEEVISCLRRARHRGPAFA
ncbi:MAG: phosphoribosyltransferase [Acidimicrobiales bacterium]